MSYALLANVVITVVSIACGFTWEMNGAVKDQAGGPGLADQRSRSYSSKLAKCV